MDISTAIALASAVILVATGIAAYRKDKSSAGAIVADSAVGMFSEVREENKELKAENRELKLQVQMLEKENDRLSEENLILKSKRRTGGF